MAHFAKIDENNVVLDVVVVNNNDIDNLPFPESEPVGIAYLNNIGLSGNWKQTSYNNKFRFWYSGIGYKFNPECGQYGGFSAPPSYPDFVFDTTTCTWIPPVPYPNDGNTYYWNDQTHSWIKVPTVTVIG